jgi:nitrite reductase/ring-hydroxylating ferredoxin subunit
MAAADTPNHPDETEGAGLDRRGAIRGMSAMGLAAFAAPFAARTGSEDPITTLLQRLTGTEPAPPPAPSQPPAPAPAPQSAPPSRNPKPKPKPKPKAKEKPKPKPKEKPKPGGLVKASDKPLASTKDIPVNGGKLFESEEYIVTQPKSGQFVGFDSLCTHEGCPVDGFSGGKMSCSCHGAEFDLASGKPTAGPARKPLPKKPILVENGQIYRAKKA